jgi:hypothetical protein
MVYDLVCSLLSNSHEAVSLAPFSPIPFSVDANRIFFVLEWRVSQKLELAHRID